MQDVIAINSKGLITRFVILGVVAAAMLFGWFAIRWQIGSLLANLTASTDPNAAEIAVAAANLAPADPTGAMLAAATSEDQVDSIGLYEETVRLAPNDYRWRVELARAYAQNGQPDRAEAEFGRARELAPEYAAPRWQLGNFYLRQNRDGEAIAELKKAAAHNQTYRDQVFSLAWDFFQKDAIRVEELVDEPAARAHLAFFFAARGVADAALRNWSRLSDPDKARYGYRAVLIADGLYIQRHFPEALDFTKQLGNATDAEPERVSNPSFESNIGEAEASRFGWQIYRTEPKLEITTDGKIQHEGARSLRVTFRGFAKPALANIYQTVVVRPDQKYSLSFWVRIDNLKSQGTPMVEVLNGLNDASIARTQPFAGGTADWQRVTLEFRSPANCTGIFIRTIRGFCGDDCPISGSFWYDDFELTRQ